MTSRTKYRLLEMIPASLAWGTFILAIVLSFVKPLWAIYFIIVFDLFWVFRVLYFVFYVAVAWINYKRAINTSWLPKLKEDFPRDYEKLYHVLFLPFYNEDPSVIKDTFDNLCKVNFDLKKFIVVLGGEERNKENAEAVRDFIEPLYGDKFYKFLFTLHPANLPNEMAAKGANANYMGHCVKEFIDQQKIDYKNIVVSYFDCDTITHKDYYAYLSYKYLSNPKPTRSSYQPAVLFNNNIWQSNPITRITAFGTTFWLLAELVRPERMFTFSSHSMSWQALVDVDFFQKDIVTDDSRIFLQCFFRYDGDYSVVPMYIPVSMDTVDAPTIRQSLKNLYKQQRRWAYGIEHFPYMVWRFWGNKKISFSKKFKHLFNITEGMYSWVTAPILIFILGRLPLMVISGDDKNALLVQNSPFVLKYLMSIAMIGIFVSATLGVLLLPKRPDSKKNHSFLIMIFQWILLPFSLVLFGSMPALEAQTRLMFGKYLGFFNTPKSRK